MKKLAITLISTLLVGTAFAKGPELDVAPPKAMAADTTSDTEKMTTTRDAKNEKHIKELHAKLKITAAEENLWSAVAQAMRDSVAEIDKAVDKRASMMHGASAVEDLSAYADIAQAHADSVKKLSIAFVPLYKAMPDAQKKVADEVFMQRDHGKMMMRAK